MNDSPRATRRPRRAWPPTAPSAVAILAMAALALLLLAACGSSPSSGGSSNPGGSTSSASADSQALAYSHCMHSQGVPNFPDPDSHGVLPKVTPQQVGVSQSKFQAAETACAHLLQPTQSQTRQLMTGYRNFAHCMRSHGVQNWPDPTTDSSGRPIFNIPGIDPNSQQVSAAADACSHLLPRSSAGPRIVELCGGVGEGGECHGYGNPNS